MKIRVLSLFVALFATTALWASDFSYYGLYYDIVGVSTGYDMAEVTHPPYHNLYSHDTVIIPSSAKKNGYKSYRVIGIGSSAFAGCTNLTSITFSFGVTYIRGAAFEGCTSLASITIPEGVEDIASGAFSNCNSLTSIVVENGNSIYDSRDNCNAIIETESNTLFQGCNTTIIPNSVTSIGNNAFKGCTGLTSIIIPENVRSIEEGVFENCTGLTSVTIGNGVTSIGKNAFKGCTGLTSITIPENVRSIEEGAFFGCTGLTSVTIPNSVTSIGQQAFYGCTSLFSITLPNVHNIGKNAFYGVYNVVARIIFSGAPWGASNLNGYVDGYFIYKDSEKKQLLKCNKVAVGAITISDSVTSIGSSAFYGCAGITSITSPIA